MRRVALCLLLAACSSSTSSPLVMASADAAATPDVVVAAEVAVPETVAPDAPAETLPADASVSDVETPRRLDAQTSDAIADSAADAATEASAIALEIQRCQAGAPRLGWVTNRNVCHDGDLGIDCAFRNSNGEGIRCLPATLAQIGGKPYGSAGCVQTGWLLDLTIATPLGGNIDVVTPNQGAAGMFDVFLATTRTRPTASQWRDLSCNAAPGTVAYPYYNAAGLSFVTTTENPADPRIYFHSTF